MAFDNLLIERDAAVASVTINQPKVVNALTGGGDKSFAAGAEINELAVQAPSSGRDHALASEPVFHGT